ncbi:hypothetical protein BH10ACI1_BH10ACI1_27950 [soil metagenome]
MRNSGKPIKLLLGFNLFAVLIFLFPAVANAQETVDKTVAAVSDGVRTELITYSDLLWTLAMQPNVEINPPNSDDLNRALQLIINQRLFALEAQRLPRETTPKEIQEEIQDVLNIFPSTAEFERRLRMVGFASVKDENFERIMAQRVAIKKYLDFRFRSFVVITAEDEEKYYRDVFVPDFRRRNPGLLMPNLSEIRAEINKILTEQKIESDIETFLDEAKARAEIVILNKV